MGKKQRPEELEVGSGLVLVDKPTGWTSHDVVGRIRRLAGTRKVGHAGTLDPAATGVLVVGINRATRLLTHIVGVDKTYTATIRLGESTTTDDAEGEVLSVRYAHQVATELVPASGVARKPTTRDVARSGFGSHGSETALLPAADGALMAAVARLTGEIMQVPSTVSAIKVAGKRAYDRARAGEDVELDARPVTVDRFEVLAARPVDGGRLVDLDVEVRVSSGTYVRALARDLGEDLGVGGHLTALRRTAVGPYHENQCLSLEQLAEDFGYIGLAEAAGQLFPRRELTAQETEHLRHGRRITATGHSAGTPTDPEPASQQSSAGSLTDAHEPSFVARPEHPCSPESEDATATVIAPSSAAQESLGEPKAHSPETLTAAFAPDGDLVALLRDIPAKPGASSSPDAAISQHDDARFQAKPELVFAAG